jgi:hypothetical protein
MSQANVELHRRAIEAFNARDVEAFIAFIDPSVEFHTEFATPSAHVVRLRNGLAVYLKGYFHKEDALKDLGLSEDALEPVDP